MSWTITIICTACGAQSEYVGARDNHDYPAVHVKKFDCACGATISSCETVINHKGDVAENPTEARG